MNKKKIKRIIENNGEEEYNFEADCFLRVEIANLIGVCEVDYTKRQFFVDWALNLDNPKEVYSKLIEIRKEIAKGRDKNE